MKWNEIIIKTTTEAVEAITGFLYEIGVGGIAIEDPNDFLFQDKAEQNWDYAEEEVFKTSYEGALIKAYFPEERNILAEIEMIREKIKELPQYGLDAGEGIVELASVDEQDWANSWKKYYKPTKVSESVVIKPSWEEYEAKDEELIIELDPGMAFGTGTHETTRMCIMKIEKYVNSEDRVFDIGCGSGILSIAAAKLGAKDVTAVDLDIVAVKASKENIERNDVQDRVKALHGNLTEVLHEKADMVVANIIADIIAILAKDVRDFLKDDGIFISSGIILDKVDFVKDALEKNNFDIIEIERMGEWACIVAKKGE